MANKRASLLFLSVARRVCLYSRHMVIPVTTRHVYASHSIFPHLPAYSCHCISTTSGNFHKISINLTPGLFFHNLPTESWLFLNGSLLSVHVHSIGHEIMECINYTVHFIANNV